MYDEGKGYWIIQTLHLLKHKIKNSQIKNERKNKERWLERGREREILVKEIFLGGESRGEGGSLGICTALNYIKPSQIPSSNMTFDLNSQKGCDFEYLSGFQCLDLLFTVLIWESEGRAIDSERREWGERSPERSSNRLKQGILNAFKKFWHALTDKNDMFPKQKISLKLSFHYALCGQAGWLNYSSLANQNPLTHINYWLKLSHFCSSAVPLFTSLC